MKLCRFELVASPGQVRSGIVYSGKVYETDGANAIGVHEAADVRPLPPVGTPPSVRLFRVPSRLGERFSTDDLDGVPYLYLNPAQIVGASQIVTPPDFAIDLQYEPYLVAVVAEAAHRIGVDDADNILLGLSLMNLVVARNRLASGSARSFDIAAAVGPVLTTPDDLDENVADAERGRHYGLSVVTRVNGVDRRRGNLADLPLTFAQAISYCSEGTPLAPGDLFALGPIAPWEQEEPGLEPGDEVQVAVETLGTLSLKIATDTTQD